MRKSCAEARLRIARQHGDDGGIRHGGGLGSPEGGALLVARQCSVEPFGLGASDDGDGAGGEPVSVWRRAGP